MTTEHEDAWNYWRKLRYLELMKEIKMPGIVGEKKGAWNYWRKLRCLKLLAKIKSPGTTGKQL